MIGPEQATFWSPGRVMRARVDAGLVEERLVPGDERRRLPAGVVVIRQRRQPLVERGHAFQHAPAALLVRQLQGVVEFDGDRLARATGSGSGTTRAVSMSVFQ